MNNNFNLNWQITIDGKAATSKTTCGRLLAKKLQFSMLDTGFYYRYLTWLALKLKLDFNLLKPVILEKFLETAKHDYQYDLEKQSFTYQQIDITKQLFQPIIVEHLNYLTPLQEIRNFVTQTCQKQMQLQNTLLVGRDCGTNIAIHAKIKFFFITSEHVQTERRIKQFKNDNTQTRQEIITNLQTRDLKDEQRQIEPLKPAEDAITIDNTALTIPQTINLVYGKIQKILKAKIPQIMLFGPTNVGKSTIFNALLEKKHSLVSAEILTTRDIVKTTYRFGTQTTTLIDTGGMKAKDEHPFEKLITQQNRQLMTKTDLFLLVFDVNKPYTEGDKWYFHQIKKYRKPIIVILNKIDRKPDFSQIASYWQLGIKNLITLAARTRRNLTQLKTLIGQLIGNHANLYAEIDFLVTSGVKVGIFGQTNVGKSTFFNRLIGSNLAIVSPMKHTTTNIVQHTIWHKKHYLTFLDTAGLRRKWKKSSQIEHVAKLQITHELNRLDVGIFLIDGSKSIVEQDKRIVRFLLDQNLPIILIVNKIDLIKNVLPRQRAILQHFPHLKKSCVVYCNSLQLKNERLIRNYLLAIYQEKTRIITPRQTHILIKKLNLLLIQKQRYGRILQLEFQNGIFEITAQNTDFKQQATWFLLQKYILQNIRFKFLNPKFILKMKKSCRMFN